MDQEDKQVTQWLLTRKIEPSWLRTSHLKLKKTCSEKRKPDRGNLVKLDAYERDRRRYVEAMIGNNVDAFDDVKIT
ncbi:hypothetical protein F511_30361 [Dorcoceras hygrometricum]|uniref:Uncharacterized protein n=1 Tax=Dorcoceras hygrometricum TaxID=472368 RepID=A0A2Z7CGM0_9LAMI|nr:hypothetical protein F511_30361 [Dorcoceras hygrometricum]